MFQVNVSSVCQQMTTGASKQWGERSEPRGEVRLAPQEALGAKGS